MKFKFGPKSYGFKKENKVSELSEIPRINGCQMSDMIEAIRRTLGGFDVKFPCSENKAALHHLDQARRALGRRTERRKAEGIEGTDVETQPEPSTDLAPDSECNHG